jgi:ABC-type iron transport system FetAB ATPase subunit
MSRAGKVVLRGVTADIPEGAACIAGPSGSGKSSLLRLLDRLRDPDTGEVRYRGRDVREYDVLALRHTVSLVPQLPALLDGTVADNVRFAAELAGCSPDVDTLLEHAGLDPSFAGRHAHQLSVGEQQRVMLARSLAQEPAVLLLDEPTSALDEEARASVERTLRRLTRELDISYVLVTHDPAQADRMSDSCLRLALGGTRA